MKMPPKKVTMGFIMAVILIIAVYDVYAYNVGGTEATISWVIFEWSHNHPVVAFVFGFVMGHLFWQMKGMDKIKEAIKK